MCELAKWLHDQKVVEDETVLTPPAALIGGLKELYVRSCYSQIFDIINGRYEENREYDGVVITGNPGIGKSSSLSYVLHSLAMLKKRVVFESTTLNTAWFFDFSADPNPTPQKVDTALVPAQVAFEQELTDRNTVFCSIPTPAATESLRVWLPSLSLPLRPRRSISKCSSTAPSPLAP